MSESNRRRKDGKRIDISKRLFVSFILMTVLICLASTLSGYYQYSDTILRLYNENGYAVANIILDSIDHDKIGQYARTWTEDEDYGKILDYLKDVAAASDVAFIYIVTVSEDQTIHYVFDTSGYPLGATDPVSSHFDEVWAAWTEGKRPESYLLRHSQYGYLTSSLMPIIDSQGNVVALLLVDVWMKVIISTLNGYISIMVLISLFALLLFGVGYWLYMRRHFINPLMKIRQNVMEFARNETVTTTSLEDIRTKDEIQELAESISQMEKDTVSYIDNIQTITAERERIGAELQVANEIQADMLPRIFPPFPDRHEFEIYATMDPAKEVGGDFYDFFFVDDDHLCLVMADVSGKGVPAALFMVIAKTLIKNHALRGESPATILENVNNQLCEGNDARMFVTVWLAIIELSTGRGVAANAGHEHPTIRRRGGQYEMVIYRHSMAVAAMEGVPYREHEFRLNPGDRLYVYTDGVPEATDVHEELFGTERMLAALNQNPNADPRTLLYTVRKEIDAFVGDAPQFDDITMLGFHYMGEEGKV